jgi:hydrogenase maturation protein HypF
MDKQRLKIHIQGAVQGVGFRPLIWRLATNLHLTGWVRNTSNGLFIEAEGERRKLDQFLSLIPDEKPSIARIHSLKYVELDPAGYADFKIEKSGERSETTAWMLPDIATCPTCLSEIFDPKNRRYLYPFTNCTHCGPRFSIIESLPYDRFNTTMKAFQMCPECEAEYTDPHNRRFHAQPNACPTCGPHIELWDGRGNTVCSFEDAIERTIRFIQEGLIIAIKGLGGFHLVVDATHDDAVKRLRLKKARDEKPFAIMAPDEKCVEKIVHLSEQERRLLKSPESPIILLAKKENASNLSAFVAPNNPMLGVMLPYTPLHHILLKKLNRPIVATSGNLADETICTDNTNALSRLGHIADYFLVHNRPIAHHVDDSIVRIMADRPVVLRRARGYAPLPIMLKKNVEPSIAVGGHLKNTIAVAKENYVFISQHIGDLETENSITTLQHTLADFQTIYNITPKIIIHDKHPDYVSTHYAQSLHGEKSAVQHHLAHVFSCMADNELEPPVLGVAWDGTGYGDDGTIWGGEFFHIEKDKHQRVGHFRTFPLPGGNQAIKRPYRSAIGLLHEMNNAGLQKYQLLPLFHHCDHAELKTLTGMLEKKINSPRTSSAGRLFDAVASILDIQHMNHFEGQAPMRLEFAAWQAEPTDDFLPFDLLNENGKLVYNWQPTIEAILYARHSTPVPVHAARFHNTLVQVILAVAQKIGQQKIVLSGGTFQNKYLVEKTIEVLTREGFRVYAHQQVPPNDGGIALGQIASLTHFTSPFLGD